MVEFFKLRVTLALLGFFLIVIGFVPNFLNTEKVWWPSTKKLNYGLDIQGGLHLVMGVDVDSVVKESYSRLVSSIKLEMGAKSIILRDLKVLPENQGEIEISFAAADKAKVLALMDERYTTTLQKMSDKEEVLVYRYFDAYLLDYKNRVIQQSIETIRNRIDEFGVAEPSISQQGPDKILVQLPGMADAERAKALINTAAKLDFMLVEERNPQELADWITEVEKKGNYDFKSLKYSDYVARINQDLKGKLPEKTVVYFEKSGNSTSLESGRIPYLVKLDGQLSGDVLNDAFVSFDPQFGTPQVSLKFNSSGSLGFKNITGQNVGKRLAVVLDKVVKTAPAIKLEIGTGEAVITLGASRNQDQMREEAQMIATSLRAGALPTTLEQLEERRVGPTLGADSIRKAEFASLIGSIIIILFMLLRYKSMGLISNLSLGLNILGVLAMLTSLGATLTLPGIAGIALTVGFAVDANVLINERMREELRKGAGFQLAVKEGYSKAMSAILDANITTGATAFVLLYFGTGPVKGFAVTLLIGIMTTLFANVFFSKVLVDVLMQKFGVKKLSV